MTVTQLDFYLPIHKLSLLLFQDFANRRQGQTYRNWYHTVQFIIQYIHKYSREKKNPSINILNIGNCFRCFIQRTARSGGSWLENLPWCPSSQPDYGLGEGEGEGEGEVMNCLSVIRGTVQGYLCDHLNDIMASCIQTERLCG